MSTLRHLGSCVHINSEPIYVRGGDCLRPRAHEGHDIGSLESDLVRHAGFACDEGVIHQ